MSFLSWFIVAAVGPPDILDTFTATNGTLVTDHVPDITPTGWVYNTYSSPPGPEIVDGQMAYGDVPPEDNYSDAYLSHPENETIALPAAFKLSATLTYGGADNFSYVYIGFSVNDGTIYISAQNGKIVGGSNPSVDWALVTGEIEVIVELLFASDQMQMSINGTARRAMPLTQPTSLSMVNPQLGTSTDYISRIELIATNDSVIDVPIACLVLMLLHFDADPLVNEAGFSCIIYGAGELSTSSKFGSNALYLDHNTQGDPSKLIICGDISEPFNGTATIEWWMKRTGGGLQSVSTNIYEKTVIEINIIFNNNTQLLIDFGYAKAAAWAWAAEASGITAYVYTGTETDPDTPEACGWTDSDYHAVAICVNVDAVTCFIDGGLAATVTLNEALGTDIRVTDVQVIAAPTTTGTAPAEQVYIDELRVTVNEVRYTGSYTPATGAWLTSACDSGTS